MKLCPMCSSLSSYNSYFGKMMCNTCEHTWINKDAEFKIGDRVKHYTYGKGKILGNYHKRGNNYYWHIQYDDGTFGYNQEDSLTLVV